jgi:hypothetical protein
MRLLVCLSIDYFSICLGVLCDMYGTGSVLDLQIQISGSSKPYDPDLSSVLANQLKLGMSLQDKDLSEWNRLPQSDVFLLTLPASSRDPELLGQSHFLRARLLNSSQPSPMCAIKVYYVRTGVPMKSCQILVTRFPSMIDNTPSTIQDLLDHCKLFSPRRVLSCGWSPPMHAPLFFLQQHTSYADGFIHLVCFGN